MDGVLWVKLLKYVFRMGVDMVLLIDLVDFEFEKLNLWFKFSRLG